jgi:hypothetical protein
MRNRAEAGNAGSAGGVVDGICRLGVETIEVVAVTGVEYLMVWV